jgi:hypothetical protein
MTDTNALIIEYARQRHPLARGFGIEEATMLVEQLRARLDAAAKELDLSPNSLKRLEDKLVAWNKSMKQHEIRLTDEETLQLVREIAAYLGSVLVLHASGEWRAHGSLWTTEIEVKSPNLAEAERQGRFSQFPLLFSLGNQAATAWDLVQQGESPGLYSAFRRAKRKSQTGR